MNFFKQNTVINPKNVVVPKETNSFFNKPKTNNDSNKNVNVNSNKTQPIARTQIQVRYNINAEVFDLNQNLDILYIDKKIQLNFIERRIELDILYKKLDNLRYIINNGINNVEKITATKLYHKLYDYINDIVYNISLSIYLLKTNEVIEKYKKILTNNNSFFNSKISSDESKVNSDEGNKSQSAYITQLKLQFLMIVTEYINLKNFKLPSNFKCDECGKVATGYNKDAYIVCECGIVYEILDDSPNFKDTNRVNMASRFKYSQIGHFKEAMNRFEGKQSTAIDKEIITSIKEQMKLKNYNKETVTKDEVYDILSDLKYSKYYADINLIYFKITKKNPPDITLYIPELLELIKYVSEAYDNIKMIDSVDNSLNINWILYKLLQIVEFKCCREDFFCLKTSTKEGEYINKWAHIINYLKVKYPDDLTSKGKKRWRLIN